MRQRRHQRLSQAGRTICPAAMGLCLLAATARCGSGPRPAAASSQPVVLRVGVGQITSGNPLGGLQQVAGNESYEGLVRMGPDGRPRPWLAKSWSVTPDGLSMTLELRRDAKFTDGSPATAPALAQALRDALPRLTGPVFEDIERIDALPDGGHIEVRFTRPSPFLLETLDASIRKPGSPTVGTGPFVPAGPNSVNELRANHDYYLGRPIIDRIVVTNYPTVRAAWAEMLRNNIDMLYEVGADAVSSMQDATNVSMFSFTRAYQYVVLLNVRAPKLKSPQVRRALNAAIDRSELVRDGFDGHAAAATGLVWPQNWAVSPDVQPIAFDPQAAAARLRSNPLRFTCLVPTDYERIALVVQRQLAAVGVTMDVEAVAADRAVRELASPTLEGVLMDINAGPGMLHPYELWHTKGATNPGIGNPEMDAALDRIRYAASDNDYREAVANFQRFTTDNPPAIYLAWGERARAVTKRFDVPVEAGRDVLSTLRLWKPAPDQRTSPP
jgi:peptide/nickel transport system substrate-binding protein